MVETEEVIELIRALREKCPWDKKRKLRDLVGLFLEESYELLDAVDSGDKTMITEEVGDLLFLGLMATMIAEEEFEIDPDNLQARLIAKYKARHPHVFGDLKVKDDEDVLKQWEKGKENPFDGIPRSLPALVHAKLIQQRAARYGFDWESVTGPLDKVKEEVDEILKSRKESQEIEFGDLFFSLVNVARFLKIDAEIALKRTCEKFQQRFKTVLEKCGPDADLKEMDRIWNELKDE